MAEIFECECKKPDLYYDSRSNRLRCRNCRRRFSQPLRLIGDSQNVLYEELIRLLGAASVQQVLRGNDPQIEEPENWVLENGLNSNPLVVGAKNIKAIFGSSSS